MSYSRFTPTSDIYLYRNVGELRICAACRFHDGARDVELEGAAASLAHLREHRAAGHQVDDHAFSRLLLEDRPDTDFEPLDLQLPWPEVYTTAGYDGTGITEQEVLASVRELGSIRPPEPVLLAHNHLLGLQAYTSEAIARRLLGSDFAFDREGSFAAASIADNYRALLFRQQARASWERMTGLFGMPSFLLRRPNGSRPGTKYFARRALYWRQKTNRKNRRD